MKSKNTPNIDYLTRIDKLLVWKIDNTTLVVPRNNLTKEVNLRINFRLILVRHADKIIRMGDLGISPEGHDKGQKLGLNISKLLGGEQAALWCSTAKRAVETAECIKAVIPTLAGPESMEVLWCDNDHVFRPYAIRDAVLEFKGSNLIVVSHLRCVELLPTRIFGLPSNNAGCAEGVVIEGNRQYSITWRTPVL